MLSKKMQLAFVGSAINLNVVVDVIEDAARVIAIAENELEDGPQIADLIGMMAAKDPIKELINDMPEFLRTVQEAALVSDLSPSILEAKDRLLNSNGSIGKVTGLFFDVLYGSMSDLNFAARTFHESKNRLERWKETFGKMSPDPIV